MCTEEKIVMPDAEVILYRNYFEPSKTQHFMTELLKSRETQWEQSPVKIFGKVLLEPRQSAYHGDYPYRYSGYTREPLPWDETLLEIKSLIEPISGVTFNAVFLNFYRDGNDSVGWHSDDQKELGSPVITSVSFGATRKFMFQKKDDKTLKRNFEISDGDVLIMAGTTQKFWQHQVPKTSPRKAAQVGPRINLTYRFVLQP